MNSSSSLYSQTLLDLVGHTPIVRVCHIDTGPCELYLKLESQNPGGSIKDRMALAMVEAAERDGKLKLGGTIVEATAGNTGLALALVARQKGYKLKIVVFDKVSQEKIFHLRALGAEVIVTRNDVVKGHPDYYQDKAKALAAATPGAFYTDQFTNPANPASHETHTAPEIWEQMEHRLDAIVCGVGTGGTLTGLGRFFKRVAPDLQMVLADPKGSILAPYVETGAMVEVGSWLVEGIGEDFIPDNCDLSLVAKAYSISDAEAIDTARNVLMQEGIFGGSSSGTLIAAALRYCREQKSPKRILTFVCDSGGKYLSKIYNPYWLQDNGLTHETQTDDLRDLIARSFLQGKVITVAPSDTMHQAYAKMKSYDVSQLPVMDRGKVIGLMSEIDVLLAVTGNPAGFSMAVGKAMNQKVATIDVKAPMTDLLPIFERCHAACVVDKDQFLGLITPIDFLNYLRKRTGQS
jgi:cystathionine beta-synthase